MEWVADPNIWLGLFTLILLEIVLGIDNLVFIAILAEKLPPEQRRKARLVGLSCAMIMRLLLLMVIGFIATLTKPLFSVFTLDFSGRDIIMLVGGIFLLAKGTMELHERLEGGGEVSEHNTGKAVFWQVIAQIIVLDAVFSLDSVITAVGMVQHIPVMMVAVIVAMIVMMVASGPLMRFVNRHPTVVILCLGFLMMIGFSLVVEGFGFHIPKGYLYAAIGFSVLIEAFNQIGRRNREKFITNYDLRTRTASAVLRMLGGGKRGDTNLAENVDIIAEQAAASDVFRPEEKEMIRGVLDLAERPVRSIMSPRNEVEWLDVSADESELVEELKTFKHSRVILARDTVEEFVGVALVKDLLLSLTGEDVINWQMAMRQPLVIHENTNVLRTMEQLRRSPIQMAIIVDEHGSFEGVVTPTDILEAIAGDFPDDAEDQVFMVQQNDGSMVVEGSIDIRQLSGVLDSDLVDDGDRYNTLAGYMLWHFGHIPATGEQFNADGFTFKVLEMERRNIVKVRIEPIENTQ